jgi:hypothetical protein
MRTATPIEFRSITLNPAVDRGVIYLQSPFQHHFFEIAIAE